MLLQCNTCFKVFKNKNRQNFLENQKIVIEVDGLYWHNYPNGREIDKIRTKEMQEKGYKVLRFWENKFTEDDVINKLKEYDVSII
jgi:very-short-patch-repair endonuclease